jgi:hypothetical protein
MSSASAHDQDQVYWTLVIRGPMTLSELQAWTTWTKHRTNQALYLLRKQGCVALVERGQHRSTLDNQMRCGKWTAITEEAVRPIVDAIVVEDKETRRAG